MDILILIFATWRVSSLITYESGPLNIFGRLRGAAGGEVNKGLECLWCNSVWVGIILTIIYLTLPMWVLLPLAASAAAILLEEFIEKLGNQHTDES